MNKISRFLDSVSGYSTLILRIGVGAAFTWFGWNGLMHTDMWVRLVPSWALSLGSAVVLVKIHGTIEFVFGLLLILGVWRRLSAFILFLSILHTLFLVSGPTFTRDFAIMMAALSLVIAPVKHLAIASN